MIAHCTTDYYFHFHLVTLVDKLFANLKTFVDVMNPGDFVEIVVVYPRAGFPWTGSGFRSLGIDASRQFILPRMTRPHFVIISWATTLLVKVRR